LETTIKRNPFRIGDKLPAELVQFPEIARRLRHERADGEHADWSDAFFQIFQLSKMTLQDGVGRNFHAGLAKHQGSLDAGTDLESQMKEGQHVAANLGWKGVLQGHEVSALRGLFEFATCDHGNHVDVLVELAGQPPPKGALAPVKDE